MMLGEYRFRRRVCQSSIALPLREEGPYLQAEVPAETLRRRRRSSSSSSSSSSSGGSGSSTTTTTTATTTARRRRRRGCGGRRRRCEDSSNGGRNSRGRRIGSDPDVVAPRARAPLTT